MEIQITLPWPPTANTYYRNVGGRTLLSLKGRAYRTQVLAAVREKRERLALGAPLLGRLAVDATLRPPANLGGRWDIDNRAKALLDAMQFAGIFEDDAQVDRLAIERNGIAGDAAGAAIVSVREILSA